MPVQDLFMFSDLPSLNSSPESVRNAFKSAFGNVNPDGISVNSETYFNAVKPAITERYGHPCYKTLGEFSYTKGNSASPTSVIVGSNIVVNYGDEVATMTLEVQGSWQNEQTWSSESTTGLTISSSFTIEGVFESGIEFSVSTTVGESRTESESKTATASIEVTVPPKSKKKVVMVGTLKKEFVNYRAPISVNGMFGANFPKKVKDHYFWFLDASTVLNQTSGEITGTIKNASVFDVHTEIGQTEPLTTEELKQFQALTR
ncbi:MAG: ETX/MTX2 family pore-forming toxin [Lysinibacillus sp.]